MLFGLSLSMLRDGFVWASNVYRILFDTSSSLLRGIFGKRGPYPKMVRLWYDHVPKQLACCINICS